MAACSAYIFARVDHVKVKHAASQTLTFTSLKSAFPSSAHTVGVKARHGGRGSIGKEIIKMKNNLIYCDYCPKSCDGELCSICGLYAGCCDC